MRTRQITRADAGDNQLRALYEAAFPAEERIPWPDLMRLLEEMSLDFTAYYQADRFIGFTIVYPQPTFNWYWYFAVPEELRGRGVGQQILTRLIDRYKGQTCVLDMESPEQQPCDNLEQRQRRHRFYLRNGFRDTHVYRTYNDITFTVMIMGEGTFTMRDWDEITGELKRFWWPSHAPR